MKTGMHNWQFTRSQGAWRGRAGGHGARLDRRQGGREGQGEGSAVIELAEIWRTYHVGDGVVHALQRRDLAIAAGEHVSLVGPSGSGKSTMLHILGCLDRPTRGRYVFEGREVGSLAEDERSLLRRHRIGFVFQFFHLLPRLTAIGNVELPMLFAGRGRRAARARAGRPRLGRPGATRRAPPRPALRRRAAARRDRPGRGDGPALLLADEPTGNLDRHSAPR